jgi:hypothetical protein
MAPNVGVMDELGIVEKTEVYQSKYYPSIFLEGQRKPAKFKSGYPMSQSRYEPNTSRMSLEIYLGANPVG